MSAGSQVDDVAVVIPARNEADRIRQTVTAAAGLPGVGLVVVVDDGSRDGTGAVARRAGAVVLRHARNRGKAAAMQSGANAVGLVDQRERRERPRHLLFLDADLAESAAQAGPLTDPVLGGHGRHDHRRLRRDRQARRARPGRRAVRGRHPPCGRLAAGPAAERPALPDPGGVRGGAPAGARLGGGDRAHHRPAAPGLPGHRGRGGAGAPGHRHRRCAPSCTGRTSSPTSPGRSPSGDERPAGARGSGRARGTHRHRG